MEWFVECEDCGESFTYIGPEPVTCPRCHSPNIETDGERESQTSKHCDAGYMNDVRFGVDNE